MINELLDEALNGRIERAYKKQSMGGDAKAKITLKMEVGHDRGYPYD